MGTVSSYMKYFVVAAYSHVFSRCGVVFSIEFRFPTTTPTHEPIRIRLPDPGLDSYSEPWTYSTPTPTRTPTWKLKKTTPNPDCNFSFWTLSTPTPTRNVINYHSFQLQVWPLNILDSDSVCNSKTEKNMTPNADSDFETGRKMT